MVDFTYKDEFGTVEFTNPRVEDGRVTADRIVFTFNKPGDTSPDWQEKMNTTSTNARSQFIKKQIER